MIAFSISLALTSLGVAAVLPLLRKTNMWDVPNNRSSHVHPVPRGGGVIVVPGVILAVGLGAVVQHGEVPWVLLGVAAALSSVGLLDDIKHLSGESRLASQLVAATAVAWWASVSYDGLDLPTAIFFISSVVLITGYVNAYNFMDGINGISALNALVAGGWFSYLGYRFGTTGLEVTGFALAGASLGFLPWNAPKAKIFLGDVGSYGLGLLIIGMAVGAWADGVPWLYCAAPLVPYGSDTLWALIKRARGRRPLMTAHREHVYQRLVDSGWSHLEVALLTASVSLGCVSVVAALGAQTPLAAALMGALVVAYVSLPRLIFPSSKVTQ